MYTRCRLGGPRSWYPIHCSAPPKGASWGCQGGNQGKMSNHLVSFLPTLPYFVNMVGQLRFGHNSRRYNDLEFLNAKHYGNEPWRCYHFLNLLSEGKIFSTLGESFQNLYSLIFTLSIIIKFSKWTLHRWSLWRKILQTQIIFSRILSRVDIPNKSSWLLCWLECSSIMCARLVYYIFILAILDQHIFTL